MSYLCYQYRVHDVPVGTEKTRDMIERVRYLKKHKHTCGVEFYFGKYLVSKCGKLFAENVQKFALAIYPFICPVEVGTVHCGLTCSKTF